MKSTFSLLISLTLLTPLTQAQTTIINNTCSGSIFNNICCINGQFTGPALSTFLSSFATRESSLDASLSSQLATLASLSLPAPLATDDIQGGRNAQRGSGSATVTARAVLEKRVITTEVSPGLTCVGDEVRTLGGRVNGSGTTVEGSVLPTPVNGVGAGSTSTSAAGAVNAQVGGGVLVGGVVVAFVYGVL
ncbi:hypothetical protein HYALB_00010072 [Hymenoscyphus albidus]|uniref:Hydrophobin n=1 Tax=Hymenoscyphus albidus TaxID=595503 RepID=A0A9N9LRH7_9HELO|nr:hypothetical protein HYALB_00010072 [Hymenoscyphus albidus]